MIEFFDAGAAGRSVLVVDDDDFVRRACVHVVTSASSCTRRSRVTHRVSGGWRGEQNQTHAAREGPASTIRIALVLMDLQMPHMDGLTCVRAFRAWEATQQNRQRTLTVAVSANGDDAGWRDECLAAGFDDVVENILHKIPPLKIKTLKDLLVRAERHTLNRREPIVPGVLHIEAV